MAWRSTGYGPATSSAFQDYCLKYTANDGSNELASDSGRRMMTKPPSHEEQAFPMDMPGNSDPQAEAGHRAKLVRAPSTETGKPGAVSKRSTRPSGLKRSTFGSAPPILPTLPAKDSIASKRGNRRCASMGQSKPPAVKSRQLSHEGGQLQMPIPPGQKRRRSEQDMSRTSEVAPQDPSRAGPAPWHNGSPPSMSKFSFGNQSPFGSSDKIQGHEIPPVIQYGPGHEGDRSSARSSEAVREDTSDVFIQMFNRPFSTRNPESGHEDGRSSAKCSDVAIEDAPDLSVPRSRRPFPIRVPTFEPYHEESISAVRVAHGVFATMKKVLSGKTEPDGGYIYIFCLAENPGFVKIGRTKDPIESGNEHPIDCRKKQIERCFTYNLEIISSDDDFSLVENHTRVERLVHLELRNYRRRFPCPCRQVSHDGDAKDAWTNHGEWFEISSQKAAEVVTRWRNWMSTEPYLDGNLKPREKAKIDKYRKNPRQMKTMVYRNKEDQEDWRWDGFLEDICMEDTHYQRCRLWLLWLLEYFCGPQKRSNCSRKDSLFVHWKSNVLFVLAFILVSCSLSILSEVLVFPFAFAPSSVISSPLILAFGAILYAA